MNDPAAEIGALFGDYLAAWNRRDFAAMAAMFTEPSVQMGPEGPDCPPDRAALVAALKARFAPLEAAGFDRTEIGAVEVTLCNPTTALVDLKDVRRLRADGSPIGVMDALYICNLKDGAWRMSVAMACAPGWRAG